MAIVQVSRITHRKGLEENLPQLAGAELGWVIDQRKLYVGNGTLQEGAPAIGNTEVLTEYSDILALADSYTYKGESAGYTVVTGTNASNNITRTLQSKLDDFASVRDFGATGDGTTDDTAAINRALFQLFCRASNSEVRRSLFFPAGTYRVTNTIKIPPFAKIYGEGSDSSIIKLESAADYVARTADSLQQTGANIGNNGAVAPRNIEVYGMTFWSNETTSEVMLVQDTEQMYFEDVNFQGPLARSDLSTAGDDLATVRFSSTSSAITKHVNFNACKFSNATWGFDADEEIQGINVTNSKFNTLYRGIQIGVGTIINGGPLGFKVTQSLFDDIAFHGIILNTSNCVSGYNIFLDVGTNFNGGDQSPVSSIVDIRQDNNVSIGDMFERGESQNAVLPRIDINNKKVFAIDKGERIKFGTYTRKVGETFDIATTISETTITTLNINVTEAFNLRYTFKDDDSAIVRHGTLNVVAAEDPDDSTGSLTYDEEYVENNSSGLVLSVTQTGNVVSVQYTSTRNGTFNYSVNHLG